MVHLERPPSGGEELWLGPVFQDLADGGGVIGGLQREAHAVTVILTIPPPHLTAPVKARYGDPR